MMVRNFELSDLDAYKGRVAGSLWERIDARREQFSEGDGSDAWLTILEGFKTPVATFRVTHNDGAQAIVARDISARGLKLLHRIGTTLLRRARRPIYAVVRCDDENTKAALRFARWMGFVVHNRVDGHYLCVWKGCAG